MRTTVELVTPKKAEEYLRHNTFNRPLKRARVERYTKDMLMGRWAENGETIKFNGDGTLLDGQHRLYGILNSGKSQKIVVVRGLPQSVFANIDTGHKRTLPDVLAIAGYKFAHVLAGAARLAYSFEDIKKYKESLSNQTLLDYVRNNPGLVDSVKFVSGKSSGKRLIGDMYLAACHYKFSEKSKPMADEFVLSIIKGVVTSESKVIATLRNKLMKYKFNKIMVPPLLKLILLVKTWNYFRMGDTPRALTANENSKMPKII